VSASGGGVDPQTIPSPLTRWIPRQFPLPSRERVRVRVIIKTKKPKG